MVQVQDEPKWVAVDHTSDVKVGNASAKEADAASEGKTVDDKANSLQKKNIKNTDPSDATPESTSTKEPIPEEGQDKLVGGKKKKKKNTLLPESDMQWRGYQDFGAETNEETRTKLQDVMNILA